MAGQADPAGVGRTVDGDALAGDIDVALRALCGAQHDIAVGGDGDVAFAEDDALVAHAGATICGDQFDAAAVHGAEVARVNGDGLYGLCAGLGHVRAGCGVVFGLAGNDLDVRRTLDLAVDLCGTADDVEVGQTRRGNAGALDADRATVHAQAHAAIGLAQHAAGGQRQVVGVDGAGTVHLNAVRVGDQQIGLAAEDFHGAIERATAAAGHFADDRACLAVQLRVLHCLATNGGDAVGHAVIEDHAVRVDVEFLELVVRDAALVRVDDVHQRRAVGGLVHGCALGCSLIRDDIGAGDGRHDADQCGA
ncbi:hypothetical protein D3C72_1047120 [compost metagenome]